MAQKHNPIQSWVIVGGGTAGWMTAALLSKFLGKTNAKITLVESPDVSTVGVGEATVPSFVDFLRLLGISEQDFIRSTQSTFKLGIKFTDWKTKNHSYWHPFGNFGAKINGQDFFQHWLKSYFNGNTSAFSNYAPSKVIAEQHKFYIPDPDKPNNLSRLGYALHFDAGLVADYLAKFSIQHGVQRISDHVTHVQLDDVGNIKQVDLKSGQTINGDFFIDCTGQKALLIDKALHVKYQDWQHYLPVNSAIVVQSEKTENLPPYTESIAHEHGWRWRIPLQNRTGNGYVYCDDFCTEQKATELLLANLSEPSITVPRNIKFNTGKRAKMWHKNCVAIGLSSGFLEPLESTSIYLIMRAALNLIKLLPDQQHCEATVSEYNRLMDIEYEQIRDFIVMHYCTSQRSDSSFWQAISTRNVPESLTNKLKLFKSHGRILSNETDLFANDSWNTILTGMGVLPRTYDPVIDTLDAQKVSQLLDDVEQSLHHSVAQLLSHDQYLQQYIRQ